MDDDNYRLNSISYDQDFDLIELYVKYINNNVTDAEKQYIESYYMSKILLYRDKLNIFLTSIIEGNFDEKKIGGTYYILHEYLYRDNVQQDNIKIYIQKFARPLRDNVIKVIDASIVNLKETFVIEDVQKIFMLISAAFCLDKDAIQHSEAPKSSYGPFKYDSKYCFLPNDTGLFGFNTWLYAYFNKVDIIGIPSRVMNFDLVQRACPERFVIHDFDHSNQIKIFYDPKLDHKYFNLYKDILSDPNTDILQKELLILSLWVLCHEHIGSTKDFFISKKVFYGNIFVAPDFLQEYNRFRDLILSQELLDQFHDDIGDHVVIGDYRRHITPKSLDEYRDFVDSQSNRIEDRVRMLGRLVMYYFREFCKKYYEV